MPKIIKKKTIKKVIKINKPEVIPEIKEEVKDEVCECPKMDRLTISFPNEDLNKLVEKINELIDKQNECTI